MQRMAESRSSPVWIEVQPGRYRYLATVENRVLIRMVLSDYLAAAVMWQERAAPSLPENTGWRVVTHASRTPRCMTI